MQSFVVCFITNDCGQEHKATNTTKEQRASFNCLQSDAAGDQRTKLSMESTAYL